VVLKAGRVAERAHRISEEAVNPEQGDKPVAAAAQRHGREVLQLRLGAAGKRGLQRLRQDRAGAKRIGIEQDGHGGLLSVS
jgi:hypothetical protein